MKVYHEDLEIWQEIVPVSKELAFEAFPNFTVFFKETPNSEVKFRCWWHEINGHFHEFPEEGTEFYLIEDSPFFKRENHDTRRN